MLKKLLFNANTNDKISCLKDLQSNSESEIGYVLRWCSMWSPLLSWFLHTGGQQTHMDAQTLSFFVRTWVIIADVHVISLPCVASIPVLGMLVFLNIKSPLFSLLAVCWNWR